MFDAVIGILSMLEFLLGTSGLVLKKLSGIGIVLEAYKLIIYRAHVMLYIECILVILDFVLSWSVMSMDDYHLSII